MPAFFDLPLFFRRVSNLLLHRYFADRPVFTDFDWSAITTRKIEPILDRFNTMTPDERRQS